MAIQPPPLEVVLREVLGVPVRLYILMILAESRLKMKQKCLRLSELSEEVNMPPTVLRDVHLNRLEELRFIKMVENGEDPLYDITQLGEQLLKGLYSTLRSSK